MKIQVKLIGPLIYEAGFSEKEFEAPAGTTAGAILRLLALPDQRPQIVTRNGRAIGLDEPLAEGDRIAVSPIYSGG
jgi:molybdopterin converting factor small subunit